ncbi:MAG TPA: hypothetical protein VFM31_03925 [Nitrososphaeraceae archaeon]|nr:hypothetical protein [Nitrososphaeraceae archaeon]
MIKIGYNDDDNNSKNSKNSRIKHRHSSEPLKTESLTCRIDKTILNKLKNEAQQKEISVNTLINQTLRHHFDWHANAAIAGFIPVRRSLIIKLMEHISEENITNIAEHIIKRETKDILLMLRGEYSIESALDFIETQIKVSGYSYRHEVNYERHHFAIKHEMGMKYSLYLKQLFRFIFEEFGLGRVVFDVRDNTLSFTVDTLSLI